MDEDAAFEAQVLLFLWALMERRPLAALAKEARGAFHDVARGGVTSRGGEALRTLIPADSGFWEIADAERGGFRSGLAMARGGGSAERAETATLRTAVAALLEIANAGGVYADVDAALP